MHVSTLHFYIVILSSCYSLLLHQRHFKTTNKLDWNWVFTPRGSVFFLYVKTDFFRNFHNRVLDNMKTKSSRHKNRSYLFVQNSISIRYSKKHSRFNTPMLRFKFPTYFYLLIKVYYWGKFLQDLIFLIRAQLPHNILKRHFDLKWNWQEKLFIDNI